MDLLNKNKKKITLDELAKKIDDETSVTAEQLEKENFFKIKTKKKEDNFKTKLKKVSDDEQKRITKQRYGKTTLILLSFLIVIKRLIRCFEKNKDLTSLIYTCVFSYIAGMLTMFMITKFNLYYLLSFLFTIILTGINSYKTLAHKGKLAEKIRQDLLEKETDELGRTIQK